MLRLLTEIKTEKLGANHPELGLRSSSRLDPGMYEDVVARPAGNYLVLETGYDDQPGCLFVGQAGWNAEFVTTLKRGYVSPDPGCSSGWVEDPTRIAALRTGGAQEVDSAGVMNSRIRFREPGGPIILPKAVGGPAWSAADGAGAEEVFFYAVRVRPGQIAYVQSSGYKGRSGWKITALYPDGNTEELTLDEARDRFAPQGAL
jgi:hypothetical protein